MRRASLAVPLILALTTSGCVSALAVGVDEETITIPVPRLGETWSAHAKSSYSSDGYSGDSELTYTSVFEPTTQQVLDKYGQPIEAYVIRGNYEVPREDAEEGFFPTSTVQAFEKASGMWVIDGTMSYKNSHINPFDDRCGLEYEDTMISHAPTPLRFDFGQPWGHTLAIGDELSFSRPLPIEWGGGIQHKTIKVADIQTASITLNGITEGRRVAVTEQTHRIEGGQESIHQTADFKSTDRAYWADGISMPVRTEHTGDSETFRYASTSQLTKYVAGSVDAKIGSEAPKAQYTGVNKAATLHPFGFTPHIETAATDYPLEEALAAIKSDPNTLRFQLWLAEHPDAYAFSGTYERYPSENTYKWEFMVSDGTQTFVATTTKKPSLLGTTTESSAHDFGDFLSDNVPSPEKIRGVPLVDDATALHIGTLFLSDPDWKGFGWEIWDHPEMEEPSINYFVANGGHERDSGVLPVVAGHEKDWLAPIRNVDARLGSVAGGGGASWSCGSGGLLIPPVFNEPLRPMRPD